MGRSTSNRRVEHLHKHLAAQQLEPPCTALCARSCSPLSSERATRSNALRTARAVALDALRGLDAVPSLAVAVSRRGELLWEEAFGWAQLGVQRATPDSLYSLASISKPITATALMILVERGLVDLDAPINRYLDPSAQLIGRAGSADDATVRRVANHSSGLPLHFNMFYQQELDDMLRPPIDGTIRQYAQTVSRPGEGWQYSNLGYALLERVISRSASASTGTDFTLASFLKQEVLNPLGLAHTALGHLKVVQAEEPALAKLIAARYPERSVSRNLSPLEDYTSDHEGAAAVWSSVRDVLRFGEFHCAGEYHCLTGLHRQALNDEQL